MLNKTRINLANPAELLELPGIGPEQARAILRFRAEHGPIHGPQRASQDPRRVAYRPGDLGARGVRSRRQHRSRSAGRLVPSGTPAGTTPHG